MVLPLAAWREASRGGKERMQQTICKIALFGWPLVVLYLFKRLPPQRALIASILAGTMFLPEVQMSPVSDEAPDPNSFVLLILKFTKPNAICFAALLGVLLFDYQRVLTYRFRWFDLPMLVWCMSTYVSNNQNGVGAYDSFAMMRDKILTWGLPYFLGRIYFNDLNNFREFAIGIFLAGLAYAPMCLFEWRFFPQLHEDLYGFFPGPRNEALRPFFGIPAFRPVVFLSHGIMLGLWMVATTAVGFWLWWTGAVTELTLRPFRKPIPMSRLILGLGLTTTFFVPSFGAMCIGAAALLGIAQMRVMKFPLILIALLVISPVFLYFRISGWTGESLVEGLQDIGVAKDRLGSLEYRIKMENRLIRHYQLKPEFGYGDSNPDWRKAPRDPRDKPGEQYELAVADSLWIQTLACFGLVVLISLWTAMLLPVVRFMMVHPPRLWFNPALAPAVAAALVLIMYMNDNLFNGFYNTVYVMAAGALSSVTGTRVPSRPRVDVEPEQEVVPPSEAIQLPPHRPGILVRNRHFR
jgi:O-Antigen ligase